MNNSKSILTLLVLIMQCSFVRAEKLKYLLVKFYADPHFSQIDTINSYNVGVGESERGTVMLPDQVIFLKRSKNNLRLEVDGKSFTLYIKSVQNKYAVLQVYINPDVNGSEMNYTLRKGCVYYQYDDCKKCHQFRIAELAIIQKGGIVSTGFKELDNYIFR